MPWLQPRTYDGGANSLPNANCPMDKHRLQIVLAMKLRSLRSLHLVANRIERRLLASWDIGSTITVTAALPQKAGGEGQSFRRFFLIEDTAECLKKSI